MSRTFASLQLGGLLKSCMIVFLIQAAVVLFVPYTYELAIRFSILVLNVLISIVLGWRLYKRIYHMVFTYDDKSFTLKKGSKEVTNHRWSEFSRVSLFRSEYGDVSVRLHRNGEFFDLPASKLKLNPFDFRWEVMRFVSATDGKES
jgi:hypothetical protein